MILLRLLILLVGFSFPLSSFAVFSEGVVLSLGFVVSIVYFIFMIPYLPKFLNLSSTYGKVIFIPFVFLLLLTLVNAWYSTEAPGMPIFNRSIFLCFLIMCLMMIHSMIDKDAMQYCLWGFSLGCFLISFFFLQTNGLNLSDERASFYEENENLLGIYMSIGAIVVLLDFIMSDKLHLGIFRYFFILPLAPMILLLFATASRTAFLIFILSLIICVLLYPTKNHIIKIFILSGGTIVLLSIFIYLINNSDNFLIISRLLSAKDDNFSGRQDLWQALIPHFFDHPILGVGETGYLNIGRFTLSHTKTSGNITYGFSPHNVILEVALYTGLIGLTLWMIFWGVLVKKSIQCYKYTKNLMPIVLLVPIVAAITSGQILAAKWAYMIYAYIFATYVQIQNEDSKLY